MKWLRNMKVAGKLLVLVIPLFLSFIVLAVVSSTQVKKTKDELTKAFYEEAFVSTGAILNADRDFYQAAIAEEQLYLGGDTLDAETREGLLAEYAENVSQVEERISTALTNVSGNAELYAGFVHEGTGLTLGELETSFSEHFADWKRLYDPGTGAGDKAAQQRAFDQAREEINVMAELLENYVSLRSERIDHVITSRLYIAVVVIAVIVVSFGALAVYLILFIRGSIRYVTDLNKKIAQGDLSARVDPRKLTKDEIGQLISTVDHEVREAFQNIAKTQVVSDKQSRYQSEQVDKLVVNLERLSKGELYCDMAVTEPDEDTKGLYELYSRISENLHLTVDTLKSYIAQTSRVLGSLSDGDLRVSIDTEYRGDFVALKKAINSIVQSLNSVIAEINMAADQVATGTAQVAEGSQAISQGATEQAGAIEELTATIIQIAEQTRQNAISAGKANEYTANAKQGAAQGNDQMQGMQRAMEEINDASASISKIIKVIDDIAFQTNILALNAAVEAARAGAHGKGFAVVAEEVRNLAARSANAAKETTALIEGSIKKTEAGTQIANQTAGALAGIVEGVDKAAELTGQIAQSSQEQATGIAQVNNGIEQLSQVVQTNSATSEETAASAEELSSQAALLKSLVGRFTLKEEAGQEDPAPGDMKSAAKEHHSEPAKPRMVLNDNEFGKY